MVADLTSLMALDGSDETGYWRFSRSSYYTLANSLIRILCFSSAFIGLKNLVRLKADVFFGTSGATLAFYAEVSLITGKADTMVSWTLVSTFTISTSRRAAPSAEWAIF